VDEIHHIFFIPAHGETARLMTRGRSADQPAFSPGGRRLAFVRRSLR
jgi:Tol biopolymer transport system component